MPIVSEAAARRKHNLFCRGAILYARASTSKQETGPQIAELQHFREGVGRLDFLANSVRHSSIPYLNHSVFCETGTGRTIHRPELRKALQAAAFHGIPLLATDRTRILRGRKYDGSSASDVPHPDDLARLEKSPVQIVTLAGWDASPEVLRSQQTKRTGKHGRPSKADSVRNRKRFAKQSRAERNQQIISLHRQGHTSPEIEAFTGVSQRTVRRVVQSVES